MNAEDAELTQAKPEAERCEDGYGKNKDNTLEQSRHAHRRGDLQRRQDRSPYRRMITQGVRKVGFLALKAAKNRTTNAEKRARKAENPA
jgi:hypothetical protein